MTQCPINELLSVLRHLWWIIQIQIIFLDLLSGGDISVNSYSTVYIFVSRAHMRLIYIRHSLTSRRIGSAFVGSLERLDVQSLTGIQSRVNASNDFFYRSIIFHCNFRRLLLLRAIPSRVFLGARAVPALHLDWAEGKRRYNMYFLPRNRSRAHRWQNATHYTLYIDRQIYNIRIFMQ